MSHGPPSPPLSPASPLTVPDSLSPPELLRDHTPRPSPSTPSSVADAAPCALRGDVTPEFDVPAAAACPICLLAPSPEPHAEDMAFPCCNAFTHLPCLVRCAQLHGTCPNCRAAIDHLPWEPAIAARCEALGINMHAPSAPAPDTATSRSGPTPACTGARCLAEALQASKHGNHNGCVCVATTSCSWNTFVSRTRPPHAPCA